MVKEVLRDWKAKVHSDNLKNFLDWEIMIEHLNLRRRRENH